MTYYVPGTEEKDPKKIIMSLQQTAGNTATNTTDIATHTAAFLYKVTKNYIINGAMMVSQENGSTSGTATGYYPVDQFGLFFSNAGTQTVQQVASATPGGSPNRLRVTATAADASVGSGDFCMVTPSLEGLRVADLRWGSASAKTVTLQFGVKAPAGTFCVVFQNSAGNRSYVAEYTISAGEANTDVVKSVTLAGDTTGTWLADNGKGLEVRWGLMAGSTFQQAANSWGTTNAVGSSNQFNFMGTINNVFELFDVSLTVGTTAPAFQVPDYASELAACKRYWQKTFPYATVPANFTGNAGACAAPTGAFNSSNAHMLNWRFQVGMRGTPTIVVFNPIPGGTAGQVGDYYGAATSTPTGAAASTEGVVFSNTATATLTPTVHATANARL